jgi:hypothetical protein
LPFVLVGDVAGGTGPEEPGFIFKSYVGFAEFAGAKILYALALHKPGPFTGTGYG